MTNNGGWYAIENEFWCPCHDKITSTSKTNNELHAPDCGAIKHSILLKVLDDTEYNREVIPEREEGKGKRNSVVDEFLANLEALNNTRRRSSSKLLTDFVLNEEIYPTVSSKSPGLEVYFPQCFSPTKFEKLTSSLDKDTFQFCTVASENFDMAHEEELIMFDDDSYNAKKELPTIAIGHAQELENMTSVKGGPRRKENNLNDTTEKFSNFSLGETADFETIKNSSSQRNLTEKARRNTLNEKFNSLRNSIPDIADNTKIAKVNILKTAIQYIKKLEHEDEVYSQLKEKEKVRHKGLLSQLVKFNSTN